jgi:hypothetical protein
MRRRTVMRDLMGTLIMFLLLVGFVALLILGDNFLENFKAH